MDAQVHSDERGRRIATDPCDEPCAIEQGMRILGGKWTGSILWHLRGEPVRFNDLARMIGGASKKMVAERLSHLEGHGLIVREVVSTKPLAVQYRITSHGRSALGVLNSLRQWSEAQGPD
ncbi:MAG: helix-turn-helix transcriptional regulator [Devosiaceae bacterium]|nr:helix-turn-helix transcriptional regulator [Devosiaceae bacterium MH13]